MIDINYTRMSNINNCNMKKIECVIMDWAGTSVDYGCFAPVAAFVDSFKQMGLTVTAAETRAHMGVTKIEEIRALFSIERVGKDFREKYGRDYTEEDVQECYKRFQKVLFDTLEDYTEPIPGVVDGNVYRVLSRWLGIDTPIDSTEGKKLFVRIADELLDCECPGLYNQAIMDFGALQCTPVAPDCLFCPLSDSCVARLKGIASSLPVKQHKIKVTNRYFNYIYVRMGAYTFIHKRSGNDIWKNLYEPPLVETDREWTEEELYASPQFRGMLSGGEEPIVRLVRKGVKHVLSHRVIYANFYEVILPENSASFAKYQRISVEDLHKFAVSRLVNQFFSLILEPNN